MIELKDAIMIAQIISKAPEERLPMILSVIEKAGVTIEGLEDLGSVNHNAMRVLMDSEDFMARISETFQSKRKEDSYDIPIKEFYGFCMDQGLDPKAVKGWLARKGMIKTFEHDGKTAYTVPQRVDGKAVRCVAIRTKGVAGKDEAAEEAQLLPEATNDAGGA